MLQRLCLNMAVVKIEEGVFVGTQVVELIKEKDFERKMDDQVKVSRKP